jgi:hypothetical protein
MLLRCLLKDGCIWSAAKSQCKCIYFTLLLIFMIKYVYSSFVDIYFSFYHGRTTKIFSLMHRILCLEHIRESLAGFLITEVIN